jgi:hypothetical protein
MMTDLIANQKAQLGAFKLAKFMFLFLKNFMTANEFKD